MSKKERLIDVKAVQNMINGDVKKVIQLLKNRKLTPEAARFALDARERVAIDFVAWGDSTELREGYTFSDLFSSFEDYVTSGFSKHLSQCDGINYGFHLVEDFITDSEKLMNFYLSLDDNDEQRNIFYKNIIYRYRNFSHNREFLNSYRKNLSTIFEIVKFEQLKAQNSEQEAVYYMLKWAFTLSEEFLDEMVEKFGIALIKECVMRRIYDRGGYWGKASALAELKTLVTFLKKHGTNDFDNCYEAIVVAICPTDSDEYRKTEENKKEVISLSRDIYNMCFSEILCCEEKLKNLIATEYSCRTRVHLLSLAFDTKEDVQDRCFTISIKRSGFNSTMNDILALLRRIPDLKITKNIINISRSFSQEWSYLIVTEKLDSCEKIMDFHDKIFPFSDRISTFGMNPTATRNINFAELPHKEFRNLIKRVHIDLSSINYYFENSFVPYEFLINNSDIIPFFTFSDEMQVRFSTKEIVNLLMVYKTKLDKYNTTTLIERLFRQREDITNEQVAAVLSVFPNYLINIYNIGINKNLDIQTILTLL